MLMSTLNILTWQEEWQSILPEQQIHLQEATIWQHCITFILFDVRQTQCIYINMLNNAMDDFPHIMHKQIQGGSLVILFYIQW
jgi:hypothetical protein